jgi:hypothetical protein
VPWTPTVVVLDPSGKERHRVEGYLTRPEFDAQLRLGLARIRFAQKRWADAEAVYDEVVRQLPDTRTAAEATYWRGVCRYLRSHDPAILYALAAEFRHVYRDSIWAEKASVWWQ